MRKPQDYLNRDVIYQINLRTFTNEGTLNAAAKLLPSLKEFVDIVYIWPCYVHDQDEDVSHWSDRMINSKLNNPANPYRIKDYYNVDPEYGTNEDLKNFVNQAHNLGLKVLFDLVYFHCGPTAKLIDEHPDFVLRHPDGSIDTGEWRFPKLNFNCKGLREYLIQNMELFVRDYGVDGFRCDVADCIPLDFWAEARERVEAINPNLMMLCEGMNPTYLDVFDIHYCWHLRYNCMEIIEGDKPASYLKDNLLSFSKTNLQNSFNSILFIDNHDTANDDYDNRLEKRLGSKAVDAMFVINYLLPNVPLVYCGTEVADTNRHSLLANRFHAANLTIDWQNLLTEEGIRRNNLLKKLHTLRHNLKEVGLLDKFECVDADKEKVFAFVRGDKTRTAIIVNLSNEALETTININAVNFCTHLKNDATISIADDKLNVSLGAFGYAVVELN